LSARTHHTHIERLALIRLLFDEDGVLLKPQDWPDEIANSVESVEPEEWQSQAREQACGASDHLGANREAENPQQ
jgi:hypothetical protein